MRIQLYGIPYSDTFPQRVPRFWFILHWSWLFSLFNIRWAIAVDMYLAPLPGFHLYRFCALFLL